MRPLRRFFLRLTGDRKARRPIDGFSNRVDHWTGVYR